MSTLAYTVGWYELSPDELAGIPPEYREQAQGIATWGKGARCFFETPGEAQWLLDQIVQNNSSANLRTLTPLGAEGLFIVQREHAPGDPWPHVRFSRYTPPGGAHIIPTPPSVLGNRP